MLCAHFKKHDVSPDMYYLEWSLTLFVKFLPLNICARIWDSYLLSGESFFVRAALGLLRLFAPELARMEMEDILRFLQRLPGDMDEQALFAAIDEIPITPESLDRTIKRIDDPQGGKAASSPSLECSPS